MDANGRIKQLILNLLLLVRLRVRPHRKKEMLIYQMKIHEYRCLFCFYLLADGRDIVGNYIFGRSLLNFNIFNSISNYFFKKRQVITVSIFLRSEVGGVFAYKQQKNKKKDILIHYIPKICRLFCLRAEL